MRQAIVVIGAGASFDCVSGNVSSNTDLRPPLVTGLFDKRFESILIGQPLSFRHPRLSGTEATVAG